jgi:steroid delta-isomerase-like uncharacterized protein
MGNPNTELAIGLSLAIQDGQLLARADELLADDFLYEGAMGMVLDKAAYVGFMHGLSASFSDQEMTFLATVSGEDKVGCSWTNGMTHTGEYQGIPASGRRITARGTWIRLVRDGKIAHEWDTTDIMGMLQQLGAMG